MPDFTYDRIGRSYAHHRRPDPRIANALRTALGDAASIVNVGAGTGSYEPADRHVVAVEPSLTMIRQRPPGAAPAIQARAEALPLPDDSCDAGLAVLTLHHWSDWRAGLGELARVARHRVVLLTFDPDGPQPWLSQDYLPQFMAADRKQFPPIATLGEVLGPIEVVPLPIPHDCHDGFLGAYWRRPAAYLDPQVRAGISSFVDDSTAAGLERLRQDLASGAWQRRYRDLLQRTELDLGYRLVIAADMLHGPRRE